MHTSTGNVFNSHKTIIGFYDNKAGLYTLRYGPGYKQRDLLIMEDDTFSVKSARDYLYIRETSSGLAGFKWFRCDHASLYLIIFLIE